MSKTLVKGENVPEGSRVLWAGEGFKGPVEAWFCGKDDGGTSFVIGWKNGEDRKKYGWEVIAEAYLIKHNCTYGWNVNFDTEFEIIAPPVNPVSWAGKQVRCIRDDGCPLKNGEIYTVERASVAASGKDILYLVGHLAYYYQDRFELVEPLTAFPKALTHSRSADHDPEEERLRALWVKPAIGFCPCGIKKSACHYHAV